MITVTVEAGFGSTMFDPSPTWTDISAWFRRGDIHRGRPSVDQRFDTGTGSLVLDNRDGRFEPFNTSSPYDPDVVIGTPIRITAQPDGESVSPVFYGSARGWIPEYPTGNIDATVHVSLADGFLTLNQEDLSGLTFPAQTTDERIDAVLDAVGWPAGLRAVSPGLGTVQAVEFALPGDGGEQSALLHLQDVAEAEAGVLFMGADGTVVFQNRVAQSGATSQATFDGTLYSELDIQPDDAVLYNVLHIAREDGAQVVYDASAGRPRRVLTRDVMPMGNDAEVLSLAEWLYALFGEQRRRIDGLAFKPFKSAGLLAAELRDTVTVQHDPPGTGVALNALCAVEGIDQSFAPEDLTTVFSLVPLVETETQDYWILGTSELEVSTRIA